MGVTNVFMSRHTKKRMDFNELFEIINCQRPLLVSFEKQKDFEFCVHAVKYALLRLVDHLKIIFGRVLNLGT